MILNKNKYEFIIPEKLYDDENLIIKNAKIEKDNYKDFNESFKITLKLRLENFELTICDENDEYNLNINYEQEIYLFINFNDLENMKIEFSENEDYNLEILNKNDFSEKTLKYLLEDFLDLEYMFYDLKFLLKINKKN